MKVNHFLSAKLLILYIYLMLPWALKAQQIVSMPLTDASTGAVFTYTLSEEDVDMIYKAYKLVKKEDGVLDGVARESLRASLIKLFTKKPKTTAGKLRYAKIGLVSLELAEAVANKNNEKPQKEAKAAAVITALLQELMPTDVAKD
jgi:hypothetical protein